jgi:hypothetical protein
MGIAFVLPIDDPGHALEGVFHLLAADHPVQQPVGDVLAGDAAGGAVFHESGIVDVGHLGAADALVDPPHHVAEYALDVVVELLADRSADQPRSAATGTSSRPCRGAGARPASSRCRAATST